MEPKLSVAFCCLGNICRSPMAEAVFKHTVSESKLSDKFERIDSFGTAGYHIGEEPDSRSVQTCVKHGVPVDHLAQQLTSDDFNDFDFILVMDRSNLSNVNRIKPKGSRAQVKLFGEYKEDPAFDTIVQDPYYTGGSAFETNFKQLSHFSHVFLSREVE